MPRWAVSLGSDELARGVVQLRDLDSGVAERRLAPDEALRGSRGIGQPALTAWLRQLPAPCPSRPRAQARAILARRDELQALLAESSPGGYAKLAKEFSDLGPVVATIEAYRAVARARELARARAMPAPIPRCAIWPRRSGATLEARLPELERQVRLLLLPKDADDEKNAILEIRAGTGGDEAALFAGDLLRMYQRYADLQGLALRDPVAERERSRRDQGGRGRDHGAGACSPG